MEILEAELKNKLKELACIKRAWEDACADIQFQMEELEVELHNKSMPFESKYAALEEEVKKLTLELARPFKCNDGEVKYRNGGTRVTYESKSLDRICAGNTEVQKLLSPFRKETKVSPSVTVEVF